TALGPISVDSATTATTSGTSLTTAAASTSGLTLDTKISAAVSAQLASTLASSVFTDIQAAAATYLNDIITQRGQLGAVQNQLEYTVANLSEFSNNLAASRSRVMDTDYAAETANLTKGQILQQASTAMLAQANQMPNVILSLLK
ncbi:MAG: flagellin, partial [Burkholderiaceae bacterium]